MSVIVPLAVSGLLVIGVVVLGALVLLYVLFRGERGYDDELQGSAEPPQADARGEQPDPPA